MYKEQSNGLSYNTEVTRGQYLFRTNKYVCPCSSSRQCMIIIKKQNLSLAGDHLGNNNIMSRESDGMRSNLREYIVTH